MTHLHQQKYLALHLNQLYTSNLDTSSCIYTTGIGSSRIKNTSYIYPVTHNFHKIFLMRCVIQSYKHITLWRSEEEKYDTYISCFNTSVPNNPDLVQTNIIKRPFDHMFPPDERGAIVQIPIVSLIKDIRDVHTVVVIIIMDIKGLCVSLGHDTRVLQKDVHQVTVFVCARSLYQ